MDPTLELAINLFQRGDLDQGLALHQAGKLAAAERIYKGLLGEASARARVQAQVQAMANYYLGMLADRRGDTDGAGEKMRAALALDPANTEFLNGLAIALRKSGRLEEAVQIYQRAIEGAPARPSPRRRTIADARLNLGNALESLGRVEEAISSYRQVLAHQVGHFRAHSNLLFALLYQADGRADEIFAEHLAWARRHAGQTAGLPAWPSGGDPQKILRIGYVSPDLRRHSVASFIEPVLAQHHDQAVRVICYSDAIKPDATTERLRGMAHEWRDVAGMEDDALARLVRDDGIDILVDLAGHTANHRLLLFARKPAPVQVAYCGYPHSTGLAEMDYRLTDAVCDPPGEADRNHTEKLFRLAPVFLCYGPAPGAPPVGPPPVLDNGYVTFASFNKLAKITHWAIALWSRILEAVPGARLLLKERAFAEESARSDFRARFAAHGIQPERLELLPSAADFSAHLAVYGRADIAYNGTTTSCEAIWMGVPVVTLAGQSPSRPGGGQPACQSGSR